jgi:hypothetical protein
VDLAMNITFEDDKKCNCYRDLVDGGGGRQEIKNFSKYFGNQLISSVIKLHQRLKSAENAECYNKIAGGDNKIEKMAGQKGHDSLILKVRIQDAYRKLFNYMTIDGDGVRSACRDGDWTGQFKLVEDIHIFEVSKHKYKP